MTKVGSQRTRIAADQRLPLALKIPNAETRVAMSEANGIVRAHRAKYETAAEFFDDFEEDSNKEISSSFS